VKVYKVGGCVRDALLGIAPKDIDYVIVGATPTDIQGMIDSGYQQVGADFPVYLHPETKAEYALARVERKTGSGYLGFEVDTHDVSLEQDCFRRDITINSMAMDCETGEIIDPYGGKEDLANKIIRHTSEAFIEDPLRIIRVCRFAARYGFSIHESTIEL
jgi:tRNA nucleotidyltransferase (CCA-adding enzyme)